MIKPTKLFLLTLTIAAIVSCNQSDHLHSKTGNFPSAGAPVGSDVISSTTNMSGKENETSPKLSAYAGAAYVQPPEINNYGAVNLSYPIEVTPGRAGFQPGIGLSYSSNGGDGLLGIGWTMATGLGVLTRTTRHGQLYYDQRDTFTYNGNRLIKVEGPLDSENGIYRLEIESGFSKFILDNAEIGGTWRVIDKAGTVTVFGSDLSSRVYDPNDINKTYVWNFVKAIDLNGNYMTAEFDTSQYAENHTPYLKEIRYTGNDQTGLDANQYVRFHYTDRNESYVSKAPGFIMKMDKLLDYIEVGWDDPETMLVGDTELWRYTMVYEISEDSKRPLLKTIDSTRNTTKPEFFYQPAKHTFEWKHIENRNYNDFETNPDATKYFEGDFNGDGLSDMVFFNPETGNWKAAEAKRDGGYAFKIYGNHLRGYDKPSRIQWFKGNVTGDYNGDGRSDIAYFLPKENEFWVAEHNGKVFKFRFYGRQNIPDLDIMKCEWFPGDYDGNGLSDALLFNEPTGEWILMTNEGGFFKLVKFSQRFQYLFRDDFNPNINQDTESTHDDSEYGKDRDKIVFLNGDYNGDKRTDISIYDKRSGRWIVGENYRDDRMGFRLEWKLYKTFTAPENALFGHDRFSGDFNGDGFSDFLLFDKSKGEWILGETLDGTINFRIFSRMDISSEITRWLQGDFNGDGKTDIGFYSRKDHNFWIGEATPSGFRYRIYNNLANGPDADRVLETPLLEDEVKIGEGIGIAVQNGKTLVSKYKYNMNHYSNRGEIVFTGNFRGQATTIPELLIYDNKSDNLFFKAGNESISENPVLTNLKLDEQNVKLLNKGIPVPYHHKEAIVYYTKQTDYLCDNFEFFAIYYNGSTFENENFATVSCSDVISFRPEENFYLLDEFEDTLGSDQRLMILDHHHSSPRFVLYDKGLADKKVYLDINSGGDLDGEFFAQIESDPSDYRIFSGKFSSSHDSDPAQILLVDMSKKYHTWYLGVLDFLNRNVTFSLLEGNVKFGQNGYRGMYKVLLGAKDGNLIYSRMLNNVPVFYKLQVNDGSIRQLVSYILPKEHRFNNEYDHNGYPILYDDEGIKRLKLSNGRGILEPISQNDATITTIDRPDLMKQVYVFRWIQGDFNGDGKTDIGIFHLKERNWYFALTQGTVPDILYEAHNGIGGVYQMQYVNSSSFDNTGEDDIPDLPVNYKVCSRLTLDDGNGHSVNTYYQYKDGCAFSNFVNGYKEVDYFGFSHFEVVDDLGNRNINTYYCVPFEDLRENRALAGAIKESRSLGNDGAEYSRSEHGYQLHKINLSTQTGDNQTPSSFLIEPIEVRKYVSGTLVKTTKSHIVLLPNKYEITSRSESITDHYEDAVHKPITVTAYTEFENIDKTNEMRLKIRKSHVGTSHEVTSTYEYDSKGNLILNTSSYTGSVLQSAPDRVMQYEYDELGNGIKQVNASGSPSRIVEKKYDSKLHQFVVQEISHGDEIKLTNRYTINYANAFGGIEIITDPNGNSTYFEFDDFGRIAKQYADANSPKELLAAYSYSTDFPLSGKVVQHSGNGNNIETRIFADGLGREIHAVSSALEVPGKRYTKTGLLIYDQIGRIIRKSQTHWADDDEIDIFKNHTREKHPTTTEYDGSGRVAKITLPEGYRGEDETSISYTYNDPWEIVETHSVGRSKRTVTNARGNVLYVEDSGTGDDGKHLSANIGFAYDMAGQRIKKMNLNSTTMSIDIPAELFQVGVKDTSGHNVVLWNFDGIGQLIESSDPDLGYSKVVYNEFGEVIESLDANNKMINIEYDRLGRPVVKHLPDEEGDIEYVYDTCPSCQNALGRVVYIRDLAQNKTFSYDLLGRVQKEIRNIHANQEEEYVTDYEYDLIGRKTAITYPKDPNNEARMKVAYEHSAMGVTGIYTKVKGDIKPIVSDIEYNEFGQMNKIIRGNQTATEYFYDTKGRLEKLITISAVDGATKKIQDVTYEFKIDNSIESVLNTTELDTDGDIGSTVRYVYTYDGLNRLIMALGDYQKVQFGTAVANPTDGSTTENAVHKQFERSYAYDLNGNMMGKTIYDPETHVENDAWTYSYEGSNHAVTEINTTKHGDSRFEMQYDDVGNLVYQCDYEKNLCKRIKYDSFNRIRNVVDPDTGENKGVYEYDDQGFRVRKLSTKTDEEGKRDIEILYPSMYFGVERRHKPSAKQNNNDDAEKEKGSDKIESVAAINNIYLNGVRIAAVSSDNSARYYLTDQVDSVKVVVDDDGNVMTRMEYLPYGETWWQEGDDSHKAKYNSQELDEETNFYYFNARHYDPEIARFVTADTVIDGEYRTKGWNRYLYAGANPIVYRDPTGHWGIFLYGGSGHETITKNAIKSLNKEKNTSQYPSNLLNGRSELEYTSDLDEGISYPDVPGSRMNTTYPNIFGYILNRESSIANRSHNGDLQYWNAMSGGGETNAEVVEKIISQANDWYSRGQKAVGTEFEDRYIGALLHMIQDTRCQSHAQRNGKGEIVTFQDYAAQNEAGIDHKKYDDIWIDEDLNIPRSGNLDAVEDTKFIIDAFKGGRSFGEVERYLRQNVLKLQEGKENIQSGGYDDTLDRK